VGQGQTSRTQLIELASNASQASARANEIYLAVAGLFEGQNLSFTAHERKLAADILKRLTKNVEMSIRIAVAEKLADRTEAPAELIAMLADDRIEVARLVLQRSPVLSDSDLLHVLETGSIDHHLAVAERPHLGEIVTAALARSQYEAVIIALLRNKTARIADSTFEGLAERAREIATLQEFLITREDLPQVLAGRIYDWVGSALKSTLLARYPTIESSLNRAIEESQSALRAGEPVTSEASARKLVAKLATSGQLRASFLIRVLNQGQMDLFEHGFAALLEMDVGLMRRALYGDDPMKVALACRAAGIDRSVFLTVFNLSRHHRGVTTALSESDQAEIQSIFSKIPRNDALQKLRTAAA
jgi:uncharacterized protein (DUF2336 family)